jgi:hypothetical protein
MRILFVHGWQAKSPETYGALPTILSQQPGVEVQDIWLSQYVSNDDAVRMADLVEALDRAIENEVRPLLASGERIAIITHSFGGPLVREWMLRRYAQRLHDFPASHLIFCTPAHHGSALAQLGRGRLGRMKAWLQGGEPGAGLLDWMELGSEGQWRQDEEWLRLPLNRHCIFPFVLAAQSIDRRIYDALNSYTGEPGSDGVVRVAGMNLNYSLLDVAQREGEVNCVSSLRSEATAFCLLPGLAHSGDRIGILRSITLANASQHPTVATAQECLSVASREDYLLLSRRLDKRSEKTQREEALELHQQGRTERIYHNPPHAMLQVDVVDSQGEAVTDYDLLLTAGTDFDEQQLISGLIVDRQRNKVSPQRITFYLNVERLAEMKQALGLKLQARPSVLNHAAGYRELTMLLPARFVRGNEVSLLRLRLERQQSPRLLALSLLPKAA